MWSAFVFIAESILVFPSEENKPEDMKMSPCFTVRMVHSRFSVVSVFHHKGVNM